jgi:acyl-CoA reductase-like NAD-dependent aldehyde dehydrogenase
MPIATTNPAAGQVLETFDPLTTQEFADRLARAAAAFAGGIDTSGYGRELSQLGIREFCSAKTVWVG